VFIILVGAVSGFKDGLIVSLFSVIAIILGVLGGFKLMGSLMVLLADRFNMDEKVLPYVAFGVVFGVIVLVVNLVGKLIKVSVNSTIFGWFDNGAGALLGMVNAIFMLSVILWITESLKLNLAHHWIADSWLYPIVANFAPKVTNWVAEFFPIFKDVLQEC
jgi:membrane protein required for colicin V production